MSFEKYALSKGISSSKLNCHKTEIENGLTPYIIESRDMGSIMQLDIFSRLMKDRIIWISGVVDQQMADIVQAQLMYLDSVENSDITLHINSPGGSVLHGLGIVDVMNYIKSDVVTINVGMAASMGSILLSSGTKGKRSALPYSKVMLHQVSAGTEGNVQDMRISHLEAEKYNYILFQILAENCGKSFDEVLEISRRDKWFNSDEALQFGLIDEVVGGEGRMTKMLKGFDKYYNKEMLNK